MIYHRNFCYCIAGMQGCFAVNCGKGCFYDGCLWSITEVYDKSQKLIAENAQLFKTLFELDITRKVQYKRWRDFPDRGQSWGPCPVSGEGRPRGPPSGWPSGEPAPSSRDKQTRWNIGVLPQRKYWSLWYSNWFTLDLFRGLDKEATGYSGIQPLG